MEEPVIITEVLEMKPQQGFECAICEKTYKLKGSLRRHLQCHFDGKQFQCLCGKSFSHNYLLKRHQKTHDDEANKKKLICEVCGASYTSSGALSDHKKFKHKNEGYLCTQCEKSFKDTYQLKRHLATHSQEKEACIICGGHFRDLVCHKKRCGRKSRGPSVCCEICGKNFLERKYLKEHMKYKHSATATISCPKCGKFFRHRKSLKNHQKICSSN